MKEENENIVILDCEDLTSSIVTKDTVFGVIHKQLLDKLTEQIRESVSREKSKRAKKKLDSFIEGSKRDDNFPLNYFITGKRGSGKTTFLRQVVKKFENDDYDGINIKFLHWYDPSESFGVPADFFIEVVAAIKTKAEEFFENAHSYPSKYDGTLMLQSVMLKLDKAIVRFSQEREALSGLSEHRAANLRINDPEMNKEIQKNFKECIKLLCELYGVDAFVLVIDDIDIRTKQCYNVLENLRLFISNEYLVVLMAGDRTINIERVRERFFKEYDYKYHICDKPGKEERLSYIVSHAAQYFVKLFPVKQQFEVRSLYTLLHKQNPVVIKLRYGTKDSGGSNESFLEKCLRRIFRYAISMDYSEVRSYVDTFISLPLRNIIQILEYWIREGMLDKLDQLNSEDSDAGKKRAGQNESEQTKQVREQIEFLVRTALNHSLQDQLPDFSYSYEKLDSDDGEDYYALLLRLCQDIGDLEHGFYLSAKAERNLRYRYLSLVLAANFKRHIKDLKGFLSYLFYGPASVALYGQTLEQFKRLRRSNDSVLETQNDLRKSFEEYLHIGDWQSPSRWARHANMIWCYDLDGHHVHSGIVRICDPQLIRELNSYINSKKQDLSKYRKALALIVSMNKSDTRDNSYYISIYSYLAYILRCVECCDQIKDLCENNNAEFKKRACDELFRLTKSYTPIKSCRCPEWQIGNKMGEAKNDQIIEIKNDFFWPNNTESETIQSIMEEILEWYEKMGKEVIAKKDNIGPHIMGDFWSDFYNRLRTKCHAEKDSNNFVSPPHNTPQDDETSVSSPEDNSQGDKSISYLQVFQNSIRDFMDYAAKERSSSMSVRSFVESIGNFPLTEAFGLHADIGPTFEAMLTSTQRGTSPK